MPEEELDDLFRKSASEFRPEYDPAAWQAMEEKLDAYRPYPGFWQRFAWLSSLLLIMGLGFGVSLLLQERQRQVAGNQVAAPARPAPAPSSTPFRIQSPGPVAGSGIARGQLSQPQQAPPLDRQQAAQQALQQAGQQALQQAGQQQTLQPNKQQPDRQPNKQQQYRQPDRQKPVARQAPSLLPGPGSRPGQGQTFAGQKTLRPASPTPESPQRQTLDEAPGRLLPAADLPLPDTSSAGQASPAPDNLQVGAAPALAAKEAASDSLARAVLPQQPVPAADSSDGEKVKRPLRSRLALRLLAAPDLSAVGLRKPEGVGSSAGIELRFQLRPRWYLTAGLLKVHKKYGARPQDYGNSDYWYNRNLPDDISAVCEVLDLPLQVGYQVISRGKSAFTLHTGLSSYWMLSEDYHYYYTTGTPYTRTWSVRRENRHLFSIYNLSGLYTHRLSPALEAGIEPFVKLPLAGVGGGKVKLSSAGVYLSLGYRLR